MIIIIKNAVTGGIIGAAQTLSEAKKIVEAKSQPYIYEVKEVKELNQATCGLKPKRAKSLRAKKQPISCGVIVSGITTRV